MIQQLGFWTELSSDNQFHTSLRYLERKISYFEGVLKASQNQEGDTDTVTVGDNPASSCHSRGEALSVGTHTRDGLEDLLLLLLLLSLSRRAMAPASSMDNSSGNDSARVRLALVRRHTYCHYCCCCRSQDLHVAFTLNVRGINSRRHTQSANFTNRAETLLQSAPETEHYDDRPPTYPQSTLTLYVALV